MSRFRRAAHGVASSYISLAAAAIFSLASVPLALHYLDKPSFALWALMSTISAYFNLIDFGMSGSVARLLIDHKDDRSNGIYGSLIKTGWLVLCVQASIIVVVGFFSSPILAVLLDIPENLKADFISLLRWQCGLLAFSFVIKIFTHILTAHQRMDIVNYGQTVGLGINYLLLWYFFSHGQGVHSWIWANCVTGPIIALWLANCCRTLKLFPAKGSWGRAQWGYFHELFNFGKDLFLLGVGTQLVISSQTMIVTRMVGLEAAAAWAVGTKMFSLLTQLVWRIFDVSSSALTEMMVRTEAQLRERYQAVVMLTAAFSAFAGVTFALCNRPFIAVWTHYKIAWPTVNDVLLGAWMIVMAVTHCHICFVSLTKRLRMMPYVYMLEGAVYVGIALLVARMSGLAGVIGCSIITSILFSGAYGVWRVGHFFQMPLRTLAWDWMRPTFRLMAMYVPVALAAGWALRGAGDQMQLAIFVLLVAPVGFYLFLRFGLPVTLQRELMQRAPSRFNPLLRHIFVGSPS